MLGRKPIQVVVGYNFSHSANAALDRALVLAQSAEPYVFHFACIIDSHSGVAGIPADDKIDYQYADKVQQQLTANIEAAFSASQIATAVHFFVHARFGDAATEILGLAKGVGADLVIVGNAGMGGVERFLVGSVSDAIARDAGCTVIVARPKTYADVDLLPIVAVEPSHHYVPPHRYSYEETRLIKRPLEWPLY